MASPGTPASEHSVFSPSASARWLACPGSLQPSLLVPEGPSSPYAEEGTQAHMLAEHLLRSALRRTIISNEVTMFNDMTDHVLKYTGWCVDAAQGADDTFVESKVDFSHLTPLPNQRGTLDHCSLHASPMGGLAILTDLKYGVGIPVHAKNNSQLMIYALAVLEEWDWLYDFKRFDLRICQPRLNRFDTWEVSRKDLLAFGEYVRERSALAFQPGAPRVAGNHCRFCVLKATCPAALDALHQMADAGFEDLTETTHETAVLALDARRPELPAVGVMTIAQMARILTYRKMVENWLKAIHEQLEIEAVAGVVVPGWKVVEGRSRREWTDDDAAGAALMVFGAAAYDRKLVSPSEALVRLRAAGVSAPHAKKLIALNVTKPPGRPSLVRDSDDRDDYDDTVETGFEEITE